ncbi:MAG: hypothetical protein AAF675_12740 [Pseudomonadota bacterium]
MTDITNRDHELHSRRRGRNLAVLAACLALIVMLFALTVVKMEGTVGNPSASQAGGWGPEDFAQPFTARDTGGGVPQR